MSRTDFERALVSATGESLRTLRRRGFSMLNLQETDFDPEPNDLPAQIVDWDQRQHVAERRAA